jgi:hypothetical protein
LLVADARSESPEQTHTFRFLEALDGLLRGPSSQVIASAMKRFAPTWYLQVEPNAVGDSADERAS